MKNVHFIAIGGSVMHNLAIALHKKGYHVTGSDDEIFEPSRSRLQQYNILPEKEGWDSSRIHPEIDAVIVGMHARENNPELRKAKELDLKIFSFPEYLYEQTQTKKRAVIGGSHGKTTITSMVMHVLKNTGRSFDYMVGSIIKGFETMVGLTEKATMAVFEGDEYLASPLDPRPKFHLYKPHIGLISGIAWDHINVFPTFDEYKKQFKTFIQKIEPGGTLIYYQNDPEISQIIPRNAQIKLIPYQQHPHIVKKGKTYLQNKTDEIPVQFFGKHNMANVEGAKLVCKELGVSLEEFYQAIGSFEGAARRMQLLAENEETRIFLDFAHAPSKLQATIQAVKDQFPGEKLIACMELHSFSSLNKKFLHQYRNTMQAADFALIYVNPETVEHKNLEKLNEEDIKTAFHKQELQVFFDQEKLLDQMKKTSLNNKNLLFMSSGNFNGIDFNRLAKGLIEENKSTKTNH